jgi:hypothetical protein
MMIPTEYDLQHVQHQYRELRRQAAERRLIQLARPAAVARRSLLSRLYALLSRLHVVRPVKTQARATA